MRTFLKILANKKIILVLFICFICLLSCLYYQSISYGALGDDSPGYIYMAHKYNESGSPIYQDALVEEIISYLGETKINELIESDEINFVLPHFNYKLLNYFGKIAPKVSLGFPLLMSLSSLLVSKQIGFYFVNPLFSIASLILVFIIGIKLFNKIKFNYILSLLATMFLGISGYYWTLSVAEPITEITTAFFLLLSLLLMIIWIDKKNYFLPIAAGISFGVALNIRITAIIFLVTLGGIIFLIKNLKLERKKLCLSIILFVIFMALTFSFTLYNNSQARNEINIITGEALTPNADHTEGLAVKNWYDNRGKYRPGEGGLFIYYDVIKNIFPIPISILLLLLGFIFLFIKNKRLFAFFACWSLPTYLFFSMWVNPYHRYIFNIGPPLALLLAYSIFIIFSFIWQKSPSQLYKIVFTILAVAFVGISYFSNIILAKDVLANKSVLTTRSVTIIDYEKIKNLEVIGKEPIIIYLGNSSQYGTYVEATSGIKALKTLPREDTLNIIDNLLKSERSLYLWDDGSEKNTIFKLQQSYNLVIYKKLNFAFGDILLYSIQKNINE